MTAILRDGSELHIGDEVTTNLSSHCIGKTFIVEQITQDPGGCESGFMVLVRLKEDPERKIFGFHKDGMEPGIPGVDANWFKKL